MDKDESRPTKVRRLVARIWPHFLWVGLLAVLDLAMFRDMLFTKQHYVLSSGRAGDIARVFIYWRDFGFHELLSGNLALWNPYSYCGEPFFGMFQSALLYPPNFLHFILPLDKAINGEIILHVFLAGFFVYLWTIYRGLHPLACFLSAVLWMFGGTYFYHIYVGHLSNLCTMVWAPLLFLSIDGIFKSVEQAESNATLRSRFRWPLLGVFAGTMQILSGHPQYVYYTALAAGIYAGLGIVQCRARKNVLVLLLLVGVGVAGLSAVQLLTGIQTTTETMRSGGLSFQKAGFNSFPPQNFLTLLVPGFFGDVRNYPYWGLGFGSETCFFAGVTGFVLAMVGGVAGDRSLRRFSFSLAVVFAILALGKNTPLFEWAHSLIPGFNKFRGTAKFIFLSALFLVMLAGIGLDHLIKKPTRSLWLSIVPLLGAIALFAASLTIKSSALQASDGWWRHLLTKISSHPETALPPAFFAQPATTAGTGMAAAHAVMMAAAVLGGFGLLIFLTRFSNKCFFGIVALGVIEMFVFAESTIDAFKLDEAYPPIVKDFIGQYQQNTYRFSNPNVGSMLTGFRASDIWGEDPGMMHRYSQFFHYAGGDNPDQPKRIRPNLPDAKWLALMGCRYVIDQKGENFTFEQTTDSMPRFSLVGHYKVLPERDKIFSAMSNPQFDPHRQVFLETEPAPAPNSSITNGTVRLIKSSTDYSEVEADLPSPAILFIDDAYSPSWRVRSLQPAPQAYKILPANYCFMAIPLAAGKHLLKIEYSPSAFVIGKWISLVSLILFIGLLLWVGQPRSIARKKEAS